MKKYGVKVELAALAALGCTEEAQTITETIRSVKLVGTWPLADFLAFFNDLSDIGDYE